MSREHIGYLIRVFVADTEEKAQDEGLQLLLAERRAEQAAARVDGAARLRLDRLRRHPPPARRLEAVR